MFKDFFDKLGEAFDWIENHGDKAVKDWLSSKGQQIKNAAGRVRIQAKSYYNHARNRVKRLPRSAGRLAGRLRRSLSAVSARSAGRLFGRIGRRSLGAARRYGGAFAGRIGGAASALYRGAGNLWRSMPSMPGLPRIPGLPNFGRLFGGTGSGGGGSPGYNGNSGGNSLSSLITRAGRGGLAGLAWNTLLNSANQTGVNSSGPTGSMAGALATGAGRGAALAYAAGSAAAVPLGMAAFTTGLAAAPKAIQQFTATIVESRRTLANLNGQYAAAYARLDVHRMSRNISLASMTGDSSSRLVGALDSLENKLMPMAALTMNVVNEIAVDVANMASGMMDIVNTLPYVKDFTELFLRNPGGEGLKDFARRVAIGAFERRKPPAPPAKPGKGR